MMGRSGAYPVVLYLIYISHAQVMESIYGESLVIDLKEGGKDIVVTQENK